MPTLQQSSSAISRIRETQLSLERENVRLRNALRRQSRDLFARQHTIDTSWWRRSLARAIGVHQTFGKLAVSSRREAM